MTGDGIERSNQEFLQAALAWLRAKLEAAAPAAAIDPDVDRSSLWWTRRHEARRTEPGVDIAELRARVDRAAEAAPRPALIRLARAFGLSTFERDVLLLAAAMELDTSIPAVIARAGGDPSSRYPTFALAMALFAESSWDALSPERPLRACRLIEIHQAGATALLSARLRIDERIAAYVKGLNYLDERLAALAAVVVPVEVLPSSQEAVAATLHDWLASEPTGGIVQLAGPRGSAKTDVVSCAAQRAGRLVFSVRYDAMPTHAEDLETFVRLWSRESKLIRMALLIEGVEAREPPAQGEDADRPRSRWPAALARLEVPCFVDVRQPLADLGDAPSLTIDPPTPPERRTLWRHALALDAAAAQERAVARLADEYRLGVSEIDSVAAGARGDAAVERAWTRCATRAATALADLTRWVTPKATLGDVELPAVEKTQLERIVRHALSRAAVRSEFGFAERGGRGLGIAALFHGESGTGKTFAAEAVAHALSVGLAVVDLATVKSKYIGETEKNLRRVFDAAEAGGAVLFFDEADALFGKRSEVKDSHDRYANIEINYLLMRMESFGGVAILATNQKHALDPAFLRRLRIVVGFPFPGVAERKAIWKSVFPRPALVADLDWDRLARFQLTGGAIFNAALAAAHEAAALGDAQVDMSRVLDAIRWELRKLGKPMRDSEFQWSPPDRTYSGEPCI